jgi:cytochrome o ubiquinol oxidase subunit III
MSGVATEQKQLLKRTSIGFWLYLMTDCLLFASLCATYVVMRDATAGGPSGSDIFEMPLVLAETIILLTSSLACGLALVALATKNMRQLLVTLSLTFMLGVAFLVIEISEFAKLIGEGYGPQASGFLSAFFTLVGTHGAHVFIGLLWLAILFATLIHRGITDKLTRQLTLFGLFWHFLDLIWIFVFTVVYLMGVVT